MTANEWDHPETPEAPLYGDQEAAAASGVPLPSLRVLQSAGAMRSAKTPKTHGGFRRVEVLTGPERRRRMKLRACAPAPPEPP